MPSFLVESVLMPDVFLFRRHAPKCPQSKKGRKGTKCNCPVWRDQCVNGVRSRESMKTRDWTRAEWMLSSMIEAEKVIDPVQGKAIDEAVKDYLTDCKTRSLEPSTIRSYLNTLQAFAAFCDQRRCFAAKDISVDLITAFRSDRPGKTQKKHSPNCTAALKRAGRRHCECPVVRERPSGKTLRKELETLRGFCQFCKDRDWMAKNPASMVKQVKDDTLGALPFEQKEIDAILEACNSFDRSERNTLRAKALVLLLLYSGFRISDAAKFKRRSLNLESHRFVVRTLKTGEHVTFILGEPAVEALLATPVENEEYFFWTGEGESDLDTCIKSLRRTLDAIRRKTGINVHPHRFRDTFAVRLLEHDTPIRTVSRLLGHKSITTTERYYAHWVKSHQKLLDAAVSVLDFVS